jgi:hypothetical protein
MFEARVKQGGIIKSLIEAVKELVTEANFDCSGGGMTVQVSNFEKTPHAAPRPRCVSTFPMHANCMLVA